MGPRRRRRMKQKTSTKVKVCESEWDEESPGLNTMQLFECLYLVRLTGFQREHDIEESIEAYFNIIKLDANSPKFNSNAFKTARDLLVERCARHEQEEKVDYCSLKAQFEELSYNFCQVCLQYQCVSHLSPNTDNDWALSSFRRPVVFMCDQLNRIIDQGAENTSESHLSRWGTELKEEKEIFAWCQAYVCQEKG